MVTMILMLLLKRQRKSPRKGSQLPQVTKLHKLWWSEEEGFGCHSNTSSALWSDDAISIAMFLRSSLLVVPILHLNAVEDTDEMKRKRSARTVNDPRFTGR